MKNKNKEKELQSGRRTVATLGTLILLTAIIIGVVMAFNKLRGLWLEQCVITDVNAQVKIETGNRVSTDNIRELFGLRNGANLALIDFAEKREKALAGSPIIKEINITRKLPDKLFINVTERVPFAKLNLRGSRKDSGLVCDDEGVVFNSRRGTAMLPVIREEPPASKYGDIIEGRTLAALAVLKTLREPEFVNLSVTEIDVTKPDFLLLTLTSYKTIKLSWPGIDENTPSSAIAMKDQLRCVSDTIATNLQPATRVWNATQPGVVTADLYGNN